MCVGVSLCVSADVVGVGGDVVGIDAAFVERWNCPGHHSLSEVNGDSGDFMVGVVGFLVGVLVM